MTTAATASSRTRSSPSSPSSRCYRSSACAARAEPARRSVSGLSVPWPFHFETFRDAWNTAHFSSYLRSSVIVSMVVVGRRRSRSSRATRSARCASAARTWLFYLLLGMIIPSRPSSCRSTTTSGGRAHRHVLGDDPAADRHRRLLRDVLDAGVLPLGAAGDARGRRDRRRRQFAHALFAWPCRRAAGGADAGPAVVHVVVERVPAAAGDGDRASTCAPRRSASLLRRPAHRPTASVRRPRRSSSRRRSSCCSSRFSGRSSRAWPRAR